MKRVFAHSARAILWMLLALALAPEAFAIDADTGRNSLFNPTPREVMREMSADRPDTTESPITVDAGHFQVEMSLFDYSHDENDGVEVTTVTFGATNIKLGLFHNADIQFLFDAYVEEETREPDGNSETVTGFSDFQIRFKLNLWGNDGGRTAFALFPFVSIPTGTELSGEHVEGGIILPFSVELVDRLSLGLMSEIDFVFDDEAGEYDTEFVHTAVLGIELTDALGLYLEYVGIAGSAPGFRYQAAFSAGVTYGLSDDVQLDAGTRLGLNDPAEDIGFFTGFTVRF
jgi:Putative MetA-pathway of phenol degradation